jgi:hypothetical protein
MAYVTRTAQRCAFTIPGADWRDARQTILMDLIGSGLDLSGMSTEARGLVINGGRSARRDAIRYARRHGTEPSPTETSGALLPAVHSADVLAGALARVVLADPETGDLCTLAQSTRTYQGASCTPATASVRPFADRDDRVNRGRRVRAALKVWAQADLDLRDDLGASGFVVTGDNLTTADGTERGPSGAAGKGPEWAHATAGDPRWLARRTDDPRGYPALLGYGRPSVWADGYAHLASILGTPAEASSMLSAVRGNLSSGDLRGIMGNGSRSVDSGGNVQSAAGPAGSTTARTAPKANRGTKGRRGPKSGQATEGTREGFGGGSYVQSGTEHLDAERARAESPVGPTVKRSPSVLHYGQPSPLADEVPSDIAPTVVPAVWGALHDRRAEISAERQALLLAWRAGAYEGAPGDYATA